MPNSTQLMTLGYLFTRAPLDRGPGHTNDHDGVVGFFPMGWEAVAHGCLIWYLVVSLVCILGHTQLCVEIENSIPSLLHANLYRRRHYSNRPSPSISASLPQAEIPHVTILRPVKGIEPNLYDCLASTFRQTYPREKLTIHFCISSRTDPAIRILEQLVADFPDFDAHIFVEEEDPELQGADEKSLGPNPKIRNMSRGYREAKGDMLWIMDCNVWVGTGVCGRMVDKISGFQHDGQGMKYKFVHHLPLAVDVGFADLTVAGTLEEQRNLLDEASSIDSQSQETSSLRPTPESSLCNSFGSRLDELFLSSSHAKFYTAINTVLIAPCIVGKSNMFRRSHLDYLTSAERSDKGPTGIDFFSHNICEDHLIGDLLWRKQVPAEIGPDAEKYGKHGLVFGDLAFQPVANMSVTTYMARRVRWLRVRKFTVFLATLVEPGTESFLCSAYGAFAFVYLIVPKLLEAVGNADESAAFRFLSLPSIVLFLLFWILNVSGWCLVDWSQYQLLHSGKTVEMDDETPNFARPSHLRSSKFSSSSGSRSFRDFLIAWLGREALAGPIWVRAFWGGTGVVWRDRKFWVGLDMRVHEIGGKDIGNGWKEFFGIREGDDSAKRRQD